MDDANTSFRRSSDGLSVGVRGLWMQPRERATAVLQAVGAASSLSSCWEIVYAQYPGRVRIVSPLSLSSKRNRCHPVLVTPSGI